MPGTNHVMTGRFTLTKNQKHSDTWRRLLTEYCAERLKALRIQNEGDLDPVATAKLRGRIAEVKALMALDNDEPFIEPHQDEF